jgi:hypothetical protein
MANKYFAAGLDVARRAKRLVKKYHEPLARARVRIDFLFVTTDGEDGCALKCNGYPAMAVASAIPQKNRVGLKADARIIIDKEAWDELSERQRDALLDHEIQHFEAVMSDDTIALDGNDRPKIRIRKHDVQLGFFSVIAQRHGEHSQEVIQARALVEHARDVFLPGFDVLAKPLPGKRGKKAKGDALKALPQGGNVIDLPAGTKHAEKVAAK